MSRKSAENSPGSPGPWWEPVLFLLFPVVLIVLLVVVQAIKAA